MRLIDYLRYSSKKFSGKTAVIEAEYGASIKYDQLWEAVDRAASLLRTYGFEAGDRVAIALPNSIDWVVSFLSVLEIGGVIIPIRQTAASSEIKWIINKTKPAFFIGDSAFINKSLPFDLLVEGARVIVLSKKTMNKTSEKRRVINLSEYNNITDTADFRRDVIASECVTINFTYRGYGYPLGAMLTDENYISGLEAYATTAEFGEGHRVLAMLPFYYTYPLLGTLITPLAKGCSIVTCHGLMPHGIWGIMERYKIDVITAVPSLYSALISGTKLKKKLSNISHAFCGGSWMPIQLYDNVKAILGIDLRQGYGLTECLPVTCNPSHGNRPDTIGLTLRGSPGINVRIFDGDGNPACSGGVGEICVSGPTVMKGYLGMPKDTRDVVSNGWFHTGDLGCIDDDGYFHFVGVKKRIIKVGGHIVDLTEVESRLRGMPGIVSVRAYSVPDEKWGNVVAADITTDHERVDIKTVRSHLRQYLAPYKVPRIIHQP